MSNILQLFTRTPKEKETEQPIMEQAITEQTVQAPVFDEEAYVAGLKREAIDALCAATGKGRSEVDYFLNRTSSLVGGRARKQAFLALAPAKAKRGLQLTDFLARKSKSVLTWPSVPEAPKPGAIPIEVPGFEQHQAEIGLCFELFIQWRSAASDMARKKAEQEQRAARLRSQLNELEAVR